MVDGNVRYHGIYYLSSLYVMYQMNICSCHISNNLFEVLGDFFLSSCVSPDRNTELWNIEVTQMFV